VFESALRSATLLVVAALAACAAAAGPELGAAAAAPGFPPDEIADGAGLAAIGGCAGCHTRSDGAPLAGGAPVRTPFGTVYGSNITPDRATGIGAWSLADFARAMRTGVAPGGRHLYPAFPYDHFTRVDHADIAAIYAFLMTRRRVARTAPAPRMDFPFGFRPLIAVWNAL
jgi:mono/diheme cytochrome c family protein